MKCANCGKAVTLEEVENMLLEISGTQLEVGYFMAMSVVIDGFSRRGYEDAIKYDLGKEIKHFKDGHIEEVTEEDYKYLFDITQEEFEKLGWDGWVALCEGCLVEKCEELRRGEGLSWELDDWNNWKYYLEQMNN